MSYILEALKKAQAERQLGDTPTIHAAPAVHVAPRAAAGHRKPLLIGLAAGVLLASVAAFVTWRHQKAAPAPASATATLAALTAEPRAIPAAVAQAATPASAIVVTETAAPVAAVVAPPAAPAPARDAHPRASASPRVDAPDASAARASVRAPVRAPAPEPAQAADHAAAPAVTATPVSADDNVRPLAELPEAIQREVPKVAFGGYIYSPNPSDRLLLVDKALRHEGEQVAPGLVLEKLLPKAAVMNYKGYRYRVAY